MKHNPFMAVAMIAFGAVATGCVDSAEPAPSTDQAAAITGQSTILNELGPAKFSMSSQAHLVHTSKGDTLSAEAMGWKQSAPGVWESSAQAGAGRLIIGAEAHRLAIAEAEAKLTALRQRAASHGSDPTSAVALLQQEAQLQNLKAASLSIAQRPVEPLADISCDVSFFNLPSSPFLGFIGVLGAAQVSCSVGCETFTIQSIACTDLGCTPVGTATNFVCSTPWLSGVGMAGTLGAACAAGSSVTPPGVTVATSLPCG